MLTIIKGYIGLIITVIECGMLMLLAACLLGSVVMLVVYIIALIIEGREE